MTRTSVKESFWDYPRPPCVKDSNGHIHEVVIADTRRVKRVLEKSHPLNSKSKICNLQFYSGWIASEIVGPFKGESGTEGW